MNQFLCMLFSYNHCCIVLCLGWSINKTFPIIVYLFFEINNLRCRENIEPYKMSCFQLQLLMVSYPKPSSIGSINFSYSWELYKSVFICTSLGNRRYNSRSKCLERMMQYENMANGDSFKFRSSDITLNSTFNVYSLRRSRWRSGQVALSLGSRS